LRPSRNISIVRPTTGSVEEITATVTASVRDWLRMTKRLPAPIRLPTPTPSRQLAPRKTWAPSRHSQNGIRAAAARQSRIEAKASGGRMGSNKPLAGSPAAQTSMEIMQIRCATQSRDCGGVWGDVWAGLCGRAVVRVMRSIW
jgi:hypothetical protein